MRDSASTERVSFAESAAPSQQLTVPRQPLAAFELPICLQLLRLPRATAAYFDESGRLDASYLEAVVAHYALASCSSSAWAVSQGALQFDARFVWPGEPQQLVLRVFAAQSRVLVLTHDDAREVVPALQPRWLMPASPGIVAHAVAHGVRYSLPWVAAAQLQVLLERAHGRRIPK